MPRHVVERTFPAGLPISPTADGERICHAMIETNCEDLVT